MTEKVKSFYLESMGQDWFNKLYPFLDSMTMEGIRQTITQLKKQKVEIFPSSTEMFNAFKLTPYEKVKVVILGQDPYHTPDVAHGLAFSSKKAGYVPPSLQNIFKEVEKDCYNGLYLDQDPNLIRWAEQGVFLLNTALTVEKSKAGSHLNLWEPFTIAVLRALSEKTDPIVFLLWGKHAQKFQVHITGSWHFLATSAHPAAEAYGGAKAGFFGCKHFSKVNNVFKDKPIKW